MNERKVPHVTPGAHLWEEAEAIYAERPFDPAQALADIATSLSFTRAGMLLRLWESRKLGHARLEAHLAEALQHIDAALVLAGGQP